MGKDGGNVGPELGSIGSKYPRDELIASVLYPSAKISSGYEPEVLALADGRIVTGIVRNETADAVEIQDADAKLVKVAKDDIEARKRSDVSLMPTGLAQGLSPGDFADLIAYLESLGTSRSTRGDRPVKRLTQPGSSLLREGEAPSEPAPRKGSDGASPSRIPSQFEVE